MPQLCSVQWPHLHLQRHQDTSFLCDFLKPVPFNHTIEQWSKTSGKLHFSSIMKYWFLNETHKPKSIKSDPIIIFNMGELSWPLSGATSSSRVGALSCRWQMITASTLVCLYSPVEISIARWTNFIGLCRHKATSDSRTEAAKPNHITAEVV